MKKMYLLVSLILVLPIGVMANLTKQDEIKITNLCTTAINKKGYSDYTYKYIDLLRAQSGNYAMMGQLHKDSKHYEFNCFLNKEIKSLTIIELVIESLDNGLDTNTSEEYSKDN